MASSKRQTTMAKITRERRVQEKRELKQEKKQAAAAARLAAAAGETVPTELEDGETAEDETVDAGARAD